MKRITKIFMPAALAGLILAVAAYTAWGAESVSPSRVPTFSPEWTDRAPSDPGKAETPDPKGRYRSTPVPVPADSVADDLQKIVVLCATKPQSAQFDQAWAGYLEKHYRPGTDVNALIDEVLSRSETYVSFGDGRKGTRPPTSQQQKKVRKRMRGVANQVIQKLR